jgi:flagellar motor switch protein FliN
MTNPKRPELARYQDAPLVFEVELDRRRMPIRELLTLEVGKVIRLSRAVGEELSIYVGGALVGQGEAIQLSEGMGVRITTLGADR